MKILVTLLFLTGIVHAQSATVTGPIYYLNGNTAVLETATTYNLYGPSWKLIASGLTLAQLQKRAGL
jgi:hypothetical protein